MLKGTGSMASNPSDPGPFTAFYRDVLICRFSVSGRSNDAIVAAIRDHKITCLPCQRTDQPIIYSSVGKDPEPIPHEYKRRIEP